MTGAAWGTSGKAITAPRHGQVQDKQHPRGQQSWQKTFAASEYQRRKLIALKPPGVRQVQDQCPKIQKKDKTVSDRWKTNILKDKVNGTWKRLDLHIIRRTRTKRRSIGRHCDLRQGPTTKKMEREDYYILTIANRTRPRLNSTHKHNDSFHSLDSWRDVSDGDLRWLLSVWTQRCITPSLHSARNTSEWSVRLLSVIAMRLCLTLQNRHLTLHTLASAHKISCT